MTNLKWKDDHENSLLSVCEDVLDEGPPGADQHDGEEEQGTLQQMGDVVQHSPEKMGWVLKFICLKITDLC